MKAKRGFTLVEILIVVVILGILAAIVIPQFTEASTEAKLSSLCSDLQTVRSQIELYKVQHNDKLPGAGGASFEDAMTSTTGTDVDGDAWVDLVTSGTKYGPYLQQIPTNSFNQFATVRIDGADPGANTHGWRFNTTNGDFRADDDYDQDGDGTPGDHTTL
ncbi:MAG: type II secretion system protein [Sedimentisphaerales bacterium]|nr:type II secretion system protein [Sedimentisphaerales bacterium]